MGGFRGSEHARCATCGASSTCAVRALIRMLNVVAVALRHQKDLDREKNIQRIPPKIDWIGREFNKIGSIWIPLPKIDST